MASMWNRLTGKAVSNEQKSVSMQSIYSPLNMVGEGYFDFSNGDCAPYRSNPIVYRCVRMITEAAVSVPMIVQVDGENAPNSEVHQVLHRPNDRQSSTEFFEQVYTHLFTHGNSYVRSVCSDVGLAGLFSLRPDRIKIEPGSDGWVAAYEYGAGGSVKRLDQNEGAIPSVLHLKIYNPSDDHAGLSPLAAAKLSLDTHDAAARWNKGLLSNAARPSGALVYSAAAGNLTDSQFKRLKQELEAGFQGAQNAGRPMVLEGGLDWKSMAMSPRDMDFIDAKHSAARDIALAFGVPPMLLGIPGDNSFANYAEANRTFWRQSIVPLVKRTANSVARWLNPIVDGELSIIPDLGAIEALNEDRAALWQRINAADFLSDDEKRKLVGLAPAAKD